MLFAIARRVRKTHLVSVQHPCGIGELTVERIAGSGAGPIATGAEYRRYLRDENR